MGGFDRPLGPRCQRRGCKNGANARLCLECHKALQNHLETIPEWRDLRQIERELLEREPRKNEAVQKRLEDVQARMTAFYLLVRYEWATGEPAGART